MTFGNDDIAIEIFKIITGDFYRIDFIARQ